MKLGEYPSMSGKDARKANFSGVDGEDGSSGSPLFKAVADEWLQFKKDSGKTAGTIKQIELYLDKDILSVLGHLPI